MNIYLPIAEMSVNVAVFLGMGGAVGFLSGLFGVGGGFLMTPLLIFMGMPAGRRRRHRLDADRRLLGVGRHRPVPAPQRRHQDGRWCCSPAASSAR